MEKQLFNYNKPLLKPNNKKNYNIKKLYDIKDSLSDTKSKLDNEFKKYNFNKYWKQFDPFIKEKRVVSILGNTNNVTNAWIKCYEILEYFNILDLPFDDNYLHFDNAAFPGTFILSTNHLIKTKYPWKDKYNWVASSLFNPNESNENPLEDTYNLYKNYPNNWLMSNVNNGDVLIRKNQEDFHKRLNNNVNLYTSDLGFDVSDDYNNQELIQMPANIGQILSGILTLKPGGCLVTKQYMTFESITVSVMYAISQLFEEFYVCKPYTSREANSETYLVGIKFKEKVSLSHPYVEALFDRIGKTDLTIPLFKLEDYPKEYINDVVNFSNLVFGKQINKINHDIMKVNECLSNKQKSYKIINNWSNSINSNVENWYLENKILPIDINDKIVMRKLH